MPLEQQKGMNPLAYYGRREDGWRLRSVVAQDGLNPTQVVRYFEAPEGIDFAEGTEQPFKIDATANADDNENTTNVTVDEHRYVANPKVLKHQFDGLWTGGPARWGTDAQTQHRTIEQTITRTYPAGHGYTLDEKGNYVVVWKDATGDGFHRDGPGGSSVAVDAADVREYATAKAALMSHRPSLTSRFSPYMALREDIPGSYWREIVWRDFTHESIPFIEAMKDSPSDVQDIVEYHFGSRVAGDVQDLTANVDKDTNTVYVKCSLLLRDLAEPGKNDIDTPEHAAQWLASLPCIEAPCTRETLRIFGLNELADGEGYYFTHTYRWPGLKDSANTRKALEWACDKYILPLIRSADYTADAPTLDNTASDGTGRFYTTQTQSGSGQSAVACKVPWWRIALQKLDEDKGEDGALAFTLVIVKPEWHGDQARARIHTGTGNPLGWGVTETRVIPSVPREAAEEEMEALTSPDHRLISRRSHSEAEKGHSDISYDLKRVYDYSGSSVENKEPAGTQEVEGFQYPTVDYAEAQNNANRKNVSVTAPRVMAASVPAAILAAKAAFTANNLTARKVRAVFESDGSYTLIVGTNGYQSPASSAYGATFTESEDITWTEIEKSYRKPGSPANLSDTPADGYYWRIVTYTANIGRTSGGATDAKAHADAAAGANGWGPGSKIWPERQNNVDSIGSVWAWKVVTAITPGQWQAGAVAFS